MNVTGRLLNKCALYSYLSDGDGKPTGKRVRKVPQRPTNLKLDTQLKHEEPQHGQCHDLQSQRSW